MKAREIFSKTLPFVWAKLWLGLATVVISILILAILLGIGWLFKSDGVYLIMILIWIGATKVVSFLLNNYIGYLVKAGHIAVITEAVVTGQIPDNQVSYGKQMVKERFLTSNVYYGLDKLVAGAVRQLQKVVQKIGNFANVIPGMNYITQIINLFISIALGYIDECCLGYTFLKKEQGAFKSAADGVVIYWQNWKTLLKDAAKTTILVIVLVVVCTLVLFLLFGLIISFFNVNGWVRFGVFLIAAFTAWAIKTAFIDSYILVKMMVSYMEVVPSTVISFDLYDKLCGMSSKFKELFNKGKAEEPTPAYATTDGSATYSNTTTEDRSVFCSECGAKIAEGAKFCASCGKPI